MVRTTRPIVGLVLIAGALVGCDDSSGRPTAANDQLWRLAPEGARGGIVVSPYAIGMLEDATVAARAFITRGKGELASIDAQVTQLLAPLGGRDIKLAELGLTRDRGAALFFGEDGKLIVVVLPVRDRAAFVARAHGTAAASPESSDQVGDARCRMIQANYVCARGEDLFAKLGKAKLAAQLAKVNARGDIEVVLDVALGDSRSTIAAIGQLERGTLVMRGVMTSPPAALVGSLAGSYKPRTTIGASSGFAVIDARPMLKDAPPLPLADGVTIADVTSSLGGPLTLNIPAGDLVFDIEQPLINPGPITKLLAACGNSPLIARFGGKLIDGVCRITIPEAAIELDAWVDGTTLRLGRKRGAPEGKPLPTSPIARELATGTWSFVMWGRGSMFADSGRPEAPATSEIDPTLLGPARVTSVLNEAGLAVRSEPTKDGTIVRFVAIGRTVFANPTKIIDAVSGLTVADAMGNRAHRAAKPIADDNPGSLFAYDVAAGQAGLTLATYLVGALSQIIVPLVMPQRPASAPQPPGGARTRAAATQYATAVYPQYLKQYPDKTCPTMRELAAFVSPDAVTDDEWGNPLVVKCGKDLPEGVTGIVVVSAGPDGVAGNDDDIIGR